MKLSHLHLAVKDYTSAVSWFERVLQVTTVSMDEHAFIFRVGDVEVAVHPDWGDGDTVMTLALVSDDCERDHAALVARGARSLKGPHQKQSSINAMVAGPGRIAIEFEQPVPGDQSRPARESAH
jgi:hypothetical protein